MQGQVLLRQQQRAAARPAAPTAGPCAQGRSRGRCIRTVVASSAPYARSQPPEEDPSWMVRGRPHARGPAGPVGGAPGFGPAGVGGNTASAAVPSLHSSLVRRPRYPGSGSASAGGRTGSTSDSSSGSSSGGSSLSSYLQPPPLHARGGAASSSSSPSSSAPSSSSSSSSTSARPFATNGLSGGDDAPLDWRAFRARLVALERTGRLSPPPPSSGGARNGGAATPLLAGPPGSRSSSGAGGWFSPRSWAHELPGPETGCLLIARQEGLDLLDRSVVLVAGHDPVDGSVGFVVNKPSPLRVRELALPPGAAGGVLGALGGEPVQLGGPVHGETLTVLHPFRGLAGAQRVCDGVYYGGLPAAVELVRAGLAAPQDFRLLLGMTGWAPGQLEREVAAGAWHVVSASRGLVLPPRGLLAGDALWARLLAMIGRPQPRAQQQQQRYRAC